MIIKLIVESGVNISECVGEFNPKEPEKGFAELGSKVKELIFALHPELKATSGANGKKAL